MSVTISFTCTENGWLDNPQKCFKKKLYLFSYPVFLSQFVFKLLSNIQTIKWQDLWRELQLHGWGFCTTLFQLRSVLPWCPGWAAGSACRWELWCRWRSGWSLPNAWPRSAAYSRDGTSVYGRTRSRSSSLGGGDTKKSREKWVTFKGKVN